MTSIAHPVLPGSVPAVGGSDSSSVSERLARPAGSKALRVGLGVAIAAVMAGDVYAVLRSPVSEGRGVGSPAATATLDETPAGGSGPASTAGHVAVNPFSEAAWGASSGFGVGRGTTPGAVAGGSGTPAGSSTPAASTGLPAAPASTPSPSIVLPALPGSAGPATHDSTGSLPTNSTNTSGGNPGGDTTPEQPAAPGPVAQAVTAVVDPVETAVPEAAPVTQTVTEVATTVDQTAPTADAASVVDTSPVTTVTSNLKLR